jgi:hypothetical protein
LNGDLVRLHGHHGIERRSNSYGSGVGVDADYRTGAPSGKDGPFDRDGAMRPMVWCSVTTDNPAGESQVGDGTLTTGLAWNTAIAVRKKAASSAKLAVKAAIMISVTLVGLNRSGRALSIAACWG